MFRLYQNNKKPLFAFYTITAVLVFAALSTNPNIAHAAKAINGGPNTLVTPYRYESFWSQKYVHTAGNKIGSNLAALDLDTSYRSQKFFEERAANGYFRLRSFWSGLFLADLSGKAFDKAELAKRDGRDNFLWKRVYDSKRKASAFRNKATGLYLNVSATKSGSPLTMVKFNKSWDGLYFRRKNGGFKVSAKDIPGPSINVVAANPPVKAQPTAAPKPTVAPKPSAEPKPTTAPKPTAKPKPTTKPVPVNQVEIIRYQSLWSKKYLQVDRNESYTSTSAISKINTWESMMWIDEPLKGNNDVVRLRNRWSGYYLADTTGSEWGEVNAVDSNPNEKSQQWVKETKRQGSYALRNLASGRYLNVTDTTSGAAIVMASYNKDWDGLLWFNESVGYIDPAKLPNPGNDNPVTNPGGGGKFDPKPQSSTHNYGEAFQLTPLFFAANQMGTLTDTRLPWRRNAIIDGPHSGGWGDAGDNIMFGKAQYRAIASMCVTATFFKDELVQIGQYDEMQRQILHGTKLLTNNANVSFDANGNVTQLLAQLSDRPNDHFAWRTYEESTQYRPRYFVDRNKKGSDYAALAAAATGFCSQHFSGDYKAKLISRSKALYRFAKQYRGKGENAGVNSVYRNSNGDRDELALGALGVYAATKNNQLLNEAHNTMGIVYFDSWAGGFEHQEHLVSTLLSIWANRNDHRTQIKNYFNNWKNSGSGLKRTQAGYIVHDANNWGSIGSVAPALMNMAIYAKATGDKSWDKHIKSQIDYNLGSNPRKLSYLCGYKTTKNCSRVHHRTATGGSKYVSGQDGKNMLWGAILDGITENDYDHNNAVSQVKGNEPTVGYNAEFQAPLLYMYMRHGGAPLSDNALRNRINNWKNFK